MATMTITIDIDETTKDALTAAAAAAGESMSVYLVAAAHERMFRDTVAPYADILADHPALAALASARQAALDSRAAVRAQVLAKYGPHTL